MIFPPAFSTLLQPDTTVDTALGNAFSDAGTQFPNAEALSRAIDDDPLVFRYGGRRDTDTDFSASLLKVAAMFGAFQLRQSANILSFDPIDATPADFMSRLATTFDPSIEVAVPRISNDPDILLLPASQQKLVPDYQSMFAALPLIGGGHEVRFGAVSTIRLEE